MTRPSRIARWGAATALVTAVIVTIGAFTAVGSFQLPLPSNQTVTSASTALGIIQTGTGGTGRFEIANNTNRSDGALVAKSNGLFALRAIATEGSQGALVQITGTTSTGELFRAESQGTGRGTFIRLSNAANAYPAVEGSTFGTANAGAFYISNASNTKPALYARTNGTSSTLLADHIGTTGNVALFQSQGVNQARIDKTGKGFFNGGTQTGGADVAEALRVEGSAADYEPGDVMTISARTDSRVEKSMEAYSTRVAGVYADHPGVLLTDLQIDDELSGRVPVGVIGVVATKVSAENGVIHRGDLLVTASIPGHAMAANPQQLRIGTVLGKAMESFSGPGTGKIRVLVAVR